MGLYQSKLFLTFDDVIDYLADKGVYHAKASSSLDTKKIKKALFEYVLTGLLTPVFYYDGLVKESFEIDSKSLLIKGWICANEKMIKELFFDNDLGTNRIDLNIQEYLKIYALHKENIFSNGGITSEVFDGYVFMDTRRYKIEFPILDFDEKPIEPKNRTEILFDILEEMDRDRKNNPELEITLDDYKDKLPKTLKNDIWLTFDDLEYPKSQLDEIFDPSQSNNRQQQIADLQAENTRLQAENADLLKRITKLESEPNQATATPADKLLEEEDPRTINNLLRLLLAINEMAKAKNGKYVDFFSQDLKNNLEKISTQLDLLGYKHIGDEAYKTIRTMIRERNDKL